MSWIDLTQENGRRRGDAVGDVAMAITTNGKRTINGVADVVRFDMVIRISAEMMKKSRLLVGDRVKILFDPESRLFLLRRSQDSGTVLSAAVDKKDGGSASVKGQVRTTRTRIELDERTEIVRKVMSIKSCENIVVGDEGIMFAPPASFLAGK